MYDFTGLNAPNLKNCCRGCLKTGEDVRAMNLDEENLYQQFVKDSNSSINLFVCLYCAQLLRKFKKFILQCQEAYRIIDNYLKEDTKSQVYILLKLAHNLIATETVTLDIHEYSEDKGHLYDDDTAFDDDDLPLVMLKNEDEESISVKKKKKLKIVKVEENQDTTETLIKSEDLKLEEPQDEATYTTKEKCRKKPKKELREGFSSRMVQETEEYVVIKLTKEQVLQEMEERSKSEEYQRTLFKCHQCVKGFNFEDVLRTHMEKHSMENGSFQCDICSQYCPSAVSLRGHMKSHTTRYKCKVCGCERQARQHLLEHHSTAHTHGALRYACTQCDFCTTKRTSMQRHVKSHLAVERHACHQCGKLFKSLETLRVHTMRHDKTKRLQCDTCSRVFIYPSLLHAHVQAVHVRKDYYCVECDKEFSSRENLRLHFKKAKKHRDASSNQYECVQCNVRFASPAALTTHAGAAHGVSAGRHACGACRRVYTTRDALRAHARAKHRKSAPDGHIRANACLDCKPDLPEHKKLEATLLPEVNQSTLLES